MKKILLLVLCAMILLLTACSAGQKSATEPSATKDEAAVTSSRPEDNTAVMLPKYRYTLNGSHEVKGRQGVCSEGDYYWVSGSTTLAKYDKDWNLLKLNEDPFKGYEIEVIGDTLMAPLTLYSKQFDSVDALKDAAGAK